MSTLLRPRCCVAVVALTATALTLAGQALPQEDKFVLRPELFTEQASALARARWEAGAVVLSIPERQAGRVTVASKEPLPGDFEAHVSFELVDWTGGSGRAADMHLVMGPAPSEVRADSELVGIGRDWTGPMDLFDTALRQRQEWRYRVTAMSEERKGRLQIVRRGGEVETAYEVAGPLGKGWKTTQRFTLFSEAPCRLWLTAGNDGGGGAVARPRVTVRFSELQVQPLPPLRRGGRGGAGPPPEEGKDWVIYATGPAWRMTTPADLKQQMLKTPGWLRVGPRAELEREQKVSEEIWGGNSQDKLLKVLLHPGYTSREEAMQFLCDRLTKVHANYSATSTPKEWVAAIFEGVAYNLRLDRGNAPDSVLARGQEYDFEAEKRVLAEHHLTPRVGFGKLWLIHATGHGTTQGPVKDNLWTLAPSEPLVDPRKPGVGVYLVADGMGGTFTYTADKWEGPYRDNFGLARAMRRLGLGELTLSTSGSGYQRMVVAAQVPDDARDYGPEVLGVQPIVDPPLLRDWVVYITADHWLHIGTRTEFSTPVPASATLWCGNSEQPVKKQLLAFPRRFGGYEQALDAVIKALQDVHCGFHPTNDPRETVDATIAGKSASLQLARSADELVAGYSRYNFGAEFDLMLRNGLVPRKQFAKQWLVHATGHGTYSGPVKDDMFMMVSSQPRNGGVTIPDGMGGTFGYSVDTVEGPFQDSVALAAALKAHKLKSIGLAGEDRGVSASDDVMPPPPKRPQAPKILSITPDSGEPGTSFYITVIATGMKPWYGFRFGPGVSVFDETCLGKNPDGEGERWLATLVIDKGARFAPGQ